MNKAPQVGRYRCRDIAARIGVDVRTVQVRAPDIPGSAKIFGIWTFDPIKLEHWIAHLEAESCRATSIDQPHRRTVGGRRAG
jgi:hypothetical protein